MSGKKEAILDVDGVLAQFHEKSLEVIDQLFGKRFRMDDYFDWDVTCLLEEQADKDRLNSVLRSPGFASCLEPYPEAIRAVEALRGAGVDILFATSPNWFSETWMWERRLWLRKHFGAHEEEIAHIHRKHHLAGNVLVDDKASTVRLWAARHRESKGFLWGTPYNRSESGVARAESWAEVLDELDVPH